MKPFYFHSALEEKLGPLEERVLEAVWERKTTTARELIQRQFSELAYSTLSTTLDRLFRKGVLSREREVRAYRYAPKYSREDIARDAAGAALKKLLEANPARSFPVSYLVDIVGERDPSSLDELSRIIEEKRRQRAL